MILWVLDDGQVIVWNTWISSVCGDQKKWNEIKSQQPWADFFFDMAWQKDVAHTG